MLCLGEGKEFLFRRRRAQGEDRRKREQEEGDEHHKGQLGLVWKEGQGEQGCLVITYHVYPETAVATRGIGWDCKTESTVQSED